MSLLSLPRLLGLLGLAGLVLTPAVAAAPPASGPATMVQLTKSVACTESVALTRAGAREIDARLRLWRLEPALAASAVPALRARHALVFAQKERTYRVAATTDSPDPLQTDEWWLSQIGISGLTRARARRPCDDRRLRARRRPPRVPQPRRHPDAQRSGARPVRRRARDDGVVGHRRSAERRRPRRDLPARGAPLVGRREGRRHASRVERDLGRAPRRGAGRPQRDQPQPRLRRQRPLDRARRRRGGRIGVARRRRVRERRRPGKPARLPRRVPARHDRRSDRPERRGHSLLQPLALRGRRRAR